MSFYIYFPTFLKIFIVSSIVNLGLTSANAQEDSDLEQFSIKAFEVLENKCNNCHQERDPNKVFTRDNMSKYSKRINRQVFLWERMPQDDIKLTDQEKSDLKEWILFLKSK